MANARNNNNLIGRIPATEKLPMNFIEKDDPKNNFISFFLSVRRAYKPKDEQYYPEDLIPVKAFGHTATFVHNYVKRGDTVAVAGEIRRDDDWKDKEGNQHRGELFLYADSVSGIGSGSSNGESAGKGDESSASKRPSGGAMDLKTRQIGRAHV